MNIIYRLDLLCTIMHNIDFVNENNESICDGLLKKIVPFKISLSKCYLCVNIKFKVLK